MPLLVVGSLALDTVETPFGKVEEAVGGSAVYFSIAASFFTDVRVVGVVGRDFPFKYIDKLSDRGIDTKGIKIKDGKTFRWKGSYDYDLNQAKTIETHLNVFSGFNPEMPEEYLDSEYVFLGNIHPELQLQVLSQMKSAKFIACDTMNYWIEKEKGKLINVFKKVNMVVINESEVRQLSGESNIIIAAKKIASYGPSAVIIKRGEYGAMLFTNNRIFLIPGYPLETVFDPTGAGDSFAGGFMGYLSNCMSFNEEVLRQAVVVGSVVASFDVEDFSINRLLELDYSRINERLKQFKNLVEFKEIK